MISVSLLLRFESLRFKTLTDVGAYIKVNMRLKMSEVKSCFNLRQTIPENGSLSNNQ